MPERNPYMPTFAKGSIKVSMIQHTNVETSDVPRSQEWYGKVFGAEWTEDGPRYLKMGNTEVHLHVEANPQPHPTNHFAVEVEDWDAWVSNLNEVGVNFEAGREPKLNDSGKLAGFVRDPDGNLIEVMYHAEWH
ncbi:MAG: VOC family protein [Chloroflexota bacterium]|nr:VOC family protein [Chloroflexota bacterium]